jgi:phosphoribosylanthranilate isomerase
VTVDIKFCGLTRPEDALAAASLGAAYVGVIFAGGPRKVTPERAKEILAEVPRGIRRVGVFANHAILDAPKSGSGSGDESLQRVVDLVGLDVVQLHGEATAERITDLRRVIHASIWAVVRVTDSLPDRVASLIDLSDGLLLDAYVPSVLGGTGVSFAWEAVAADLRAIRAQRPIILAGGLRPENVAEAIAALGPNVVDVSSGVESAPGIKDHERMRAFRDAVTQASIPI